MRRRRLRTILLKKTIMKREKMGWNKFVLGSSSRNNFLWPSLSPNDELLRASKARPSRKFKVMCMLCYKWTRTRQDLENHFREEHQKLKLYKCRICAKLFEARFLCLRHEEIHKYDVNVPYQNLFPSADLPLDTFVPNHPLKRLRTCPLTEWYKKELEEILETVAETPYNCIDCPQTFSSDEELRNHFELTHASQECIFCYKKFDNQHIYDFHLSKSHDAAIPRMNIVGGLFAKRQIERKVAMEEVDMARSSIEFFHSYALGSDLDPYQYNRPNLTELRTIADYNEFNSDEQQNINKPKAKRKNSATITANKDAVVTWESEEKERMRREGKKWCPNCKKSFEDHNEYQEHMQQHLLDRPYVCQYCGKGFRSPSNRKEHERTHTGEKPYTCPFCNRGFTQSSNLKKHMQIHKDINTLQCTKCGKQFIKESSLILHQRSHSTERKFKCHQCDRAYNYSSLLRRHLRVHTGETPYQCDDCGLPFYELVSLKYHKVKAHSLERPFKCSYCNKGFILSSDHKKHLKIAHRITYFPNMLVKKQEFPDFQESYIIDETMDSSLDQHMMEMEDQNEVPMDDLIEPSICNFVLQEKPVPVPVEDEKVQPIRISKVQEKKRSVKRHPKRPEKRKRKEPHVINKKVNIIINHNNVTENSRGTNRPNTRSAEVRRKPLKFRDEDDDDDETEGVTVRRVKRRKVAHYDNDDLEDNVITRKLAVVPPPQPPKLRIYNYDNEGSEGSLGEDEIPKLVQYGDNESPIKEGKEEERSDEDDEESLPEIPFEATMTEGNAEEEGETVMWSGSGSNEFIMFN